MLPRGTRMCEAAEGDEVSNAARTQQPRENDITELRPFRVEISGAAIDDLRERLARTRWPEKEPVGDWSMGIPLAYVQELAGYWEKSYDMQRVANRLNRYEQFMTTIDGVDIHFLRVRSPVEGATPCIMTHGWPGSVIEFHKVVKPLTDPVAHGGHAADAFHLVIPSLPGFGFSDKPNATGWGIERIADAWAELMRRLGYGRFGAQGGDWGAAITKLIAQRKARGCIGIHVNMPLVAPTPEDAQNPTPEERKIFVDMENFDKQGSGYGRLQNTRPQTIGYALADSPVGQAAWIYEKLHAWSDNPGTPEQIFTFDEMLDNIMLYWLTNTGASSARLYWESWVAAFVSQPIDLPVGVSVFPGDPIRSSRRWAERFFKNIVHWNEMPRGGHFAAFEQPEAFVTEVRNSFRRLR